MARDFRQSDNWSTYLATLGWNTFKTKNNVLLYHKSAGFLRVGKVQRPYSLDSSDVVEIEAFCKEHRIQVLKFELSNDQQADLLVKAGYDQTTFNLTPPSTSQINLTKDESTLWTNLSTSAKYSVNRARRENAYVKIHRCPNEQVLKDFYAVLKETASAKNFPIQGYDDLLNKVVAFQNDSYLAMVYDKDDNLCGGKFHIGFNDRVWYLHGGTSSLGRKNKTGYLLVWESFLYFKQLGYHMLDFEGILDSRFESTKHWGGLTDFKEKFGGNDIHYPYPRVKVFNKLLGFVSRVFGVSL